MKNTNTMPNRKPSHPQRFILGVFNSKKKVLSCISSLRKYPYADSNIYLSVANPERRGEAHFLKMDKMTKNPESAITGAGIGGITGIALGAGAGLGLIPTFETAAVSGPFVTAFVGLFYGAAFGATIGAFIGSRVPEDDAKNIERSLNHHEILLSVHVNNKREEHQTQKLFHEFGAQRILLNEENERIDDSSTLERRAPPTTLHH